MECRNIVKGKWKINNKPSVANFQIFGTIVAFSKSYRKPSIEISKSNGLSFNVLTVFNHVMHKITRKHVPFPSIWYLVINILGYRNCFIIQSICNK